MSAVATSVLVVEDHPVFLQSLTRLLRDQGHFDVTAAGTAEQAVELLELQSFGLVIIDISLPGRSGIALLRAIHGLQPGLPCLILSGLVSSQYVQDALAAGARGYVLKDDVPGILDGVRAALNGGTFISQALRQDLDR